MTNAAHVYDSLIFDSEWKKFESTFILNVAENNSNPSLPGDL